MVNAPVAAVVAPTVVPLIVPPVIATAVAFCVDIVPKPSAVLAAGAVVALVPPLAMPSVPAKVMSPVVGMLGVSPVVPPLKEMTGPVRLLVNVAHRLPLKPSKFKVSVFKRIAAGVVLRCAVVPLGTAMPAVPGIVGFVTILTVYAPCAPPSVICNPLIADK